MTLKNFQLLDIATIASCFATVEKSWISNWCDTDYPYMAGLYTGAEQLSMDVKVLFRDGRIALVSTFERRDGTRPAQFMNLLTILTGEAIRDDDLPQLHQSFPKWRVSYRDNGETFCEVFDGIRYANWLLTAEGTVIDFVFEDTLFVLEHEDPNESDDERVLSGIWKRGIDPWDVNRCSDRPYASTKEVGFCQGGCVTPSLDQTHE